MKTRSGRWLFQAVAIAFATTVGLPSSAHAAFMAYICDDQLCTGGGDTIVTDQGAGDNFPGSALVGQINSGALSVGGFTIATNVAQRTNTATSSLLDLTFSAITGDNASHTIFLYASDTGFTAQGPFAFTLGGSQPPPGAGDTITGRAWGGNSNTNLDFSSLLSSFTSSSSSFALGSSGSLASLVNPYSLTIGVQITRAAAGTTTGDLNFSLAPAAVPEPESGLLVGAGLAGLLVATRKRRRSTATA